MREMGGYIEFEYYHGSIYHEGAVALNCGRNCLAYLFRSRGIKKLYVPYYICSSILDVCTREGVEKSFYHIDMNFKPIDDLELKPEEWFYLVNYYGQLDNKEIDYYVKKYARVIVDQANDYFKKPLPGVDTLYTCRKWFGVADGAFLYTDRLLNEAYPQDESYDRMLFLMGRFERSAHEFYDDYTANNRFFIKEPIKRMSKLTENLLRGINYVEVEKIRRENFECFDYYLSSINQLNLKTGLFMYPLMVDNGRKIRKELLAERIYIPTLWPAVFEVSGTNSIEYKMAENILPLPIDQRYDKKDIEYISNVIKRYLEFHI